MVRALYKNTFYMLLFEVAVRNARRLAAEEMCEDRHDLLAQVFGEEEGQDMSRRA